MNASQRDGAPRINLKKAQMNHIGRVSRESYMVNTY